MSLCSVPANGLPSRWAAFLMNCSSAALGLKRHNVRFLMLLTLDNKWCAMRKIKAAARAELPVKSGSGG
jgi:hypothetical protein